MNPEPLILRALASPDLHPDVRALAVDFLSGDRGYELEQLASDVEDYVEDSLDRRTCLVLYWWSGNLNEINSSERSMSLFNLEHTLDSRNL